MTETIEAELSFNIEDIVKFLLEETNIKEPPTNPEKIARYLKLTVRGFFHHEYKLDQKIRAYLLPANKEIGIARSLSHHRRRFSILHEVGHYVIPGHLDNIPTDFEQIKNNIRDGMLVDNDKTLADYSIIKQEMEANQFAADCLFQLDRFSNYVKDIDLNWNSVREFAGIYDTSLISTARRWVETSHKNCALLVFIPTSLRSMSALKLSYTITSDTFKQNYFARIPKLLMDEKSQVFQVFHKTTNYADWNAKLKVNILENHYEFNLLLYPTNYGIYALIKAD